MVRKFNGKKEQMKTKEEIIEYVYDMNLQNLTEKTSFDRAYKQGIEDTIEDLIELNLLTIPVVSNRRELLIRFYIETCNKTITRQYAEDIVDNYLS